MVIKTAWKEYIGLIVTLLMEIILIIYCLAKGPVYIILNMVEIIGYSIVFMLLNIRLICFDLPTMRILIMDEHGCTIKLFWHKWYYEWEELQVRKLEKKNNSGAAYTRRFYFSTKPIEKIRMKIHAYIV